MPEPTDEELGLDPQQMEGLDPNIRQELRRSRQLARENTQLQQQAAQAQREAAFAKAGVPDTPLASTLAKSYEGENDPESVKAYFEGLGVDLTSTSAGVSTNQTPPPGPSDEELAAQRRVSQLGGGGETGGDVRFEDALHSTKSESEVMELIRSAPEGALSGRPGEARFRIALPEID
jgi:hypothetical protein